MDEERACDVVQVEWGRQGVWQLPGDQVDESYYETMGDSIRFNDKKEDDNC